MQAFKKRRSESKERRLILSSESSSFNNKTSPLITRSRLDGVFRNWKTLYMSFYTSKYFRTNFLETRRRLRQERRTSWESKENLKKEVQMIAQYAVTLSSYQIWLGITSFMIEVTLCILEIHLPIYLHLWMRIKL